MNTWWRRLNSPALRIAMGLVSLMITLVLAAELFTGYPSDRGELARQHHALVARTLGQQIATHMNRGEPDPNGLQRLLMEVQQREPRLLSVRVLDPEQQPLAEIGPHARWWRLEPQAASTSDNIRVPLLRQQQAWGEVQLAFVPLVPHTLSGWLQDPFVRWLAFLIGVGLLAYALYLRRVLRHLDPNAAVPERVRAAFDTLTEGVLVLDPQGRVMLANQAFARFHDDRADTLVGQPAQSLAWLHEALPQEHRNPTPWRQAALAQAPVLNVPLRVRSAPSMEHQLVLNCAPILDGGQLRGCLASFSDVTELHERTERLREALAELSASQREIERQNEALVQLATRDALTGIFNRRSLMEQAHARFDEARASGGQICCIMCDIDHFKSVNDKFGHAGGDQVIQGAAKALLRGLRQGDFVGRYGGEEFCVMLPGGTLAQACEVAERLRFDVELHLGQSLRDHPGVRVTMSFGVAQIAAGVNDADALIDLADQALYHSKKNGRNRVTAWPFETHVAASAA